MDRSRRTELIVTGLVSALVAGTISALVMWRYLPAPAPGKDEIFDRLNNLEFGRRDEAETLARMEKALAAIADRPAGEVRAGDGGSGLKNLPPDYVREVERFFVGEAAMSLLSPAARADGGWRFAKPVFIEPQLVSVVYANGRRTETMMCRVDILDYYDLQFVVLWDSREGRP